MNWNKLKEKYPLASKELRAFYLKSKIEDGRTLIERFLESKGYPINLMFKSNLDEYEEELHSREKFKVYLDISKKIKNEEK